VAGFTGGRLLTANTERTQRAFPADVSTLLGHSRINCSVTRGAETRRNMEAQSLGHFELLPTVRPSESLTSDWSVLDNVANDLYRAGRSDIALEMLEAAVQTMPLDGNLHFIHGRMLAASNRRTEALAALSRALALGTEREVLTVVADVAFPGPCYICTSIPRRIWRSASSVAKHSVSHGLERRQLASTQRLGQKRTGFIKRTPSFTN